MKNANDATILIVDDDAEIRSYLTDLVIDLGATPLQADDGHTALQAVKAVVPDLILMDVEMPRMNGMIACRKLKTDPITTSIPVIMITSMDARDARVNGIEAGADDFLTKPIHVPEFRARVKSLLRIKKLIDSLESAENVVFALAAAIESKDKYTQGHTERVTSYAVELGRATGCSEDELRGIRQGGSLHDIGKIGVPDHILNKPGQLTPEEMEVVRQHPITGYNICLPMKSLAHTLPCIRWHHEKPNGSGYPDGLSGSQIPQMARILAVADVYDALTSKRSYKAAMLPDEAFLILSREGETGGLDATYVEIFIKAVMPFYYVSSEKPR